MEFGYFGYYFIAINLIGFLLLAVNAWLRAHTAARRIDTVLMLAALLGGAAGVMLAILLFERKPQKDRMLLQVFVTCVLVIQILIFFMMQGRMKNDLSFAFWEFFGEHQLLRLYLLFINVITILAFGIDKAAAKRQRTRIRIATLLGLAFAGGSVGALIAMYAFRHKTKKDYFTVGIPLILLTQTVFIFFLMNLK